MGERKHLECIGEAFKRLWFVCGFSCTNSLISSWTAPGFDAAASQGEVVMQHAQIAENTWCPGPPGEEMYHIFFRILDGLRSETRRNPTLFFVVFAQRTCEQNCFFSFILLYFFVKDKVDHKRVKRLS